MSRLWSSQHIWANDYPVLFRLSIFKDNKHWRCCLLIIEDIGIYLSSAVLLGSIIKASRAQSRCGSTTLLTLYVLPVRADAVPNYFSNSTQSPIAGTVTELSTVTSALTVTVFTTCFTVMTATATVTTTYGNTTVLSTTTTTKFVTLPPDKLPRNMIRAPATDTPKANGLQETVTFLTTITAVTTLTTCAFTVSQTVTLVTTQTQKLVVDQLITETQTVFVGASPVTTTTSSTPKAIPPVQQVTTTTSSTAKDNQETTTSSRQNAPAPADPSPTPQSTTTINGIPFTISPVPSNTAVVVNEVTILPGEAFTTEGIEFSNGPTGLEVSTATSVGAIVASIFGVTTGVVIGGSTLTPGGTLILSGTTYVLPTGGTVPAIVTGSSPTSISPDVPKGEDGGPSVTVTGTESDAAPTYIQAAGASKEKLHNNDKKKKTIQTYNRYLKGPRIQESTISTNAELEALMRQNAMNPNQRFAGFGAGSQGAIWNGLYFTTNNNYPGVPARSGILAFNNLNQMQHHIQRPDRAFAIEYESGPRPDLSAVNFRQNLNRITHFVGGPYNERSFGPGLGTPFALLKLRVIYAV
ncbi:hypothetical protein IFR05_009866 [Cadophora sp. M221]|nr:hypothetical protein IFR05_009866 [Cadophora sp. M221]